MPVRFDLSHFLDRHRRSAIALLCLIAAVRVFLSAAAIPFFNTVDELYHFDVVSKYAAGEPPRGVGALSAEAIGYISLYHASGHYRDEVPDPTPPPVWDHPPDVRRLIVEESAELLRTYGNWENTQAPLYYAIAGVWLRVGRLLGLEGGFLLYWLKFLNVPIIVLLVLTAHFFMRRFYPGDCLRVFGVPMLAAVIPQDVFYSISNDVLTPLCMAWAFYGLMTIWLDARAELAQSLCTGLAIAASLLTKYSNVTILAVGALVLPLTLRRMRREGTLAQNVRSLSVCIASAVLPVTAWLIRSMTAISNTDGLYRLVGWSVKPFEAMWNHPIFTAKGLGLFLTNMTTSFWRGEIGWHGVTMHSDAMDVVFVATTVLFLAAAAIWLVVDRGAPRCERCIDAAGFFFIGVSLLFWAFISIRYDWGTILLYPSPDYPYVSSGRLIGGILIPFLALYVAGLGRILSLVRFRRGALAVVTVLAVLLAIGDGILTANVAGSRANFFHMLGRPNAALAPSEVMGNPVP